MKTLLHKVKLNVTKVGNDCVIGARSLLSGKEYGDGTLIA